MPEVKLARTALDKILEPYESSNTDHEFRTTPIVSVEQFAGDVVSVDLVNKIAWLKFKPQKIVLFRKGDGDKVAFGSSEVAASDAETNLQKGGSTDGARDMAIEGITISSAGQMAQFFNAGDAITGFGVAPTDDDVKAALYGQGRLCDPFALVVPAQLQSPYLLEDCLFQEILNLSTVEIITDSSRPFKVGGADLMPGSAGSSYKRANGNPDSGNVYAIPEGIIWNRDSKPDSDLKVNVTLERTIVMPLSLVTFPGGGAATPPKKVFQRIRMRLHGKSVSELANN